MSEALVKAILPWYGGKRTLAPDIVAELGEHTQYFEPFCGSMAVLFAKAPSQKETVNDLHGYATNLAKVIQYPKSAEDLYDRLQRVIMCEGILLDAQRWLESCGPDIGTDSGPYTEAAYWYFLASWMGRNGTSGTARQDYQLAVRWTKNGGSPTVRFRHAVDSIPWWHERLRNVVILRRDAFAILPKFEDVPGTAIYLDPPYMADTRSRNDGAGRYLYEFQHTENLLEADDHVRLCRIASSFRRARVVVSYYDCPQVRQAYAGWTFVSKARHKHLAVVSSRTQGVKECPEILIINGQSYATDTGAGN